MKSIGIIYSFPTREFEYEGHKCKELSVVIDVQPVMKVQGAATKDKRIDVSNEKYPVDLGHFSVGKPVGYERMPVWVFINPEMDSYIEIRKNDNAWEENMRNETIPDGKYDFNIIGIHGYAYRYKIAADHMMEVEIPFEEFKGIVDSLIKKGEAFSCSKWETSDFTDPKTGKFIEEESENNPVVKESNSR